VLEAYEDRYNEPIKLSMVSTYLARFTSKGILARNRSGREWRYKRVLLKH
jgi:predicted transcriptional regulator